MINRLLNLFFPGGERNKLVDQLFAQADVQLPSGRSLNETNAYLQQYMNEARPEGVQRWEMSDPKVFDATRFDEIARDLSLNFLQISPELHEGVEVLVIPGATFKAMYHRLHQALAMVAKIGKVVILASQRVLNKGELETVGLISNLTEAGAAQCVFQKTKLPDSVYSQEVLTASNRPCGGYARTDETIELLLETVALDPTTKVAFALHHPYGLRQALTILNIFNASSMVPVGFEPQFIIGDPLNPLSDVPGRTLDEVCKLIYELSKVDTALLA